ncbi:hypothetical protein [Bacteroides congonensis]
MLNVQLAKASGDDLLDTKHYDGDYWSSTEYDGNTVWCVKFSDEGAHHGGAKTGSANALRAILAF